MDGMQVRTEREAHLALAQDRANRIRDVADRFGTSERHIWRLVKSGILKAERLGPRCTRIFDSEIARYRQSLAR